MLLDTLPHAVRRSVYVAYAALGLVLGAIQVGYGTTEPTWVTQALAVYAFVGTGVGLTARAHTPTQASTGPSSSRRLRPPRSPRSQP